jgi:hypothetical protein
MQEEMEAVAVSKKSPTSKKLLETAYKNPMIMAERLQLLIRSEKGELLEPVMFKGEGYGSYYSQSDKKFLKVARKSAHYLIPWRDPKDEDARFVYTHHIAHVGVILRVNKDDFYKIGFN